MKNKILGVYLELTKKCNLKCIHCYNNSGESNDEIDYLVLIRLINYLKEKNIDSITFSGGEPFLYSNILKLLNYCLQVNMQINLISNLHCLNDSVLNLVKKGNSNIQISIDGINDIYNLIRKNGNFDFLKKNIDKVYHEGISISFNYVINQLNIHQIVDFVELVNKNWPKSAIGFSFINYSGRALDNYNDLNIDNIQKEECINIVNKLSIKYKTLVKKLEYTTSCPFNNLKDAELNLRIDPDGNVYPCQISSGDKYIIGNINNNDLSDIINSSKFFNLRKEMLKNSKCSHCVYKKNCGHCCPIEVNDYENSYGCYMIKKVNNAIFKTTKQEIVDGIFLDFFNMFKFCIKFNELNIPKYLKIKKFFGPFICNSNSNESITIIVDNENFILNNTKIHYNGNELCISLLKIIENELVKMANNGIMIHGGLICNENNENIILLGKTGSGKSTSIYNLIKSNQNIKYGGDDLLYYDFQKNLLYPFPKPIFLRKNFNDDEIKKLDVEYNDNEKRYLYYPEKVLKAGVSINKIFILNRNKEFKQQSISEIHGGKKLIELLLNLKESINTEKIKKINQLVLKTKIYNINFFENLDIEKEKQK